MRKLFLVVIMLMATSSLVMASATLNRSKVVECSATVQSVENNNGTPVSYTGDIITVNNAYLSQVDLQPAGRRVKVMLRGLCGTSFQQFKTAYDGWNKIPVDTDEPVVVFSDTNVVINSENHRFTASTPFTSTNQGSTSAWVIYITLDLDESEWNEFRQSLDAWDGVVMTRDNGSLVTYSRQ